MSVREFAAHLGVSDRMVSKWESGRRTIQPRPLNQAALDTSLAMSSPLVKHRFEHILADYKLLPQQPPRPDQLVATSQVTVVKTLEAVRHPFDGKLMTLIEAGPVKPVAAGLMTWLPAFYIDIAPTTHAEYQRFLDVLGTPTNPEPDTQDPYAIAEDPDDDEPVVGLTWAEVNEYARWTDKHIPTPLEWERATNSPNAIAPLRTWEYCHADGQPTRHGPLSENGGFRTATLAADLHALLAI
jgi:hypothetical protein